MEQTELLFQPEAYAQLRNQQLRLWWPNGYGEPYLYDAGYQLLDAKSGALLSEVNYKAGIRQMSYKELDTRTTLTYDPAASASKHTYLHFDGINWKAEVMLNGEQLGRIDGAFIRARFDITKQLKPGDNLLEVRVIKNAHFGAVKEKTALNTDLNGGVLGGDNPTFHATIGWDWITSLPGREVGIWNDVYLTRDGGVRVYDPVVTTTLNLPDTLAALTPAVRIANEEETLRQVKVIGHIGQISFEK